MRCPVCSSEHPTRKCPRCGFDSSRDYTKYPTFGTVGRVPTPSALKKEWDKQQSVEETTEIPNSADVKIPVPPEKPKKKIPWFIVAAFAVTLIAGILIGTGMGGGRSDPTEPLQLYTLRSDVSPFNWLGYVEPDVAQAHSVLGSDYRREEIISVQFLTSLADAPADAWDVSQEGDSSVLAWVVPVDGLYELHIGAEGAILAPEDCRGLFAGYTNVRTIDFGTGFHTDHVQFMPWMFYGCSSLTNLILSSFNTFNVTNMKYMFSTCSSLTNLVLSSFDTSNVTNMTHMFYDCPAGDYWQHLLN